MPEEQQLEEAVINHIDKAELTHIVETLPVPVNNATVQSDFISTLDKHQVYNRLEKIFLAIKNEKKETDNGVLGIDQITNFNNAMIFRIK